MYGIVLRWGIAVMAGTSVVAVAAQPSAAAPDKAPRTAFAQAPGPQGAAKDPASTASLEDGRACAKSRKKLWTEDGWMVRRVTVCR